MKKILIIKLGSTFPWLKKQRGDFENWIITGSCLPSSDFRVVDVVAGESLPDPDGFAAVILTGSHHMVTEHRPWSEKTADWIHGVIRSGVPLLGICYGHQLLAHALGGDIGDNPHGIELGLTRIRLTPSGKKDPLFKGLPGEFLSYASHGQSVLRLPQAATLLASGSRVGCQAFAWGRKAWGIQFHPEEDNMIAAAYVKALSKEPAAGKGTPAELPGRLEAPLVAGVLLKRFVKIVFEAGTHLECPAVA